MPVKKLEIGVIGLGKFGMQMAMTLVKLGHTVVGVDVADAPVQLAQEHLDNVYKADASNLPALNALRFKDLDCVVVSMGQRMEQSLSVTLNLQELGVPRIWVKAANKEHQKILRRLGVEHAILPAHDAATMAAYQLSNPGMLDMIPKYGGIVVQELTVDQWAGKTLMELNLISRYEVIIIGIRSAASQHYAFVPPARTVLNKGDVLVVVGRQVGIQQLQA